MVNISDEEIWEIMGWNEAWECFMRFLEVNLPFDEKKLNELPVCAKNAVTAHLYTSEVMGDGHRTFLEIYGDYITADMLAAAFNDLHIPGEFRSILRDMERTSIDDEEGLEKLDKRLYSLPPEIIPEAIAEQVKNHIECFEV